MGATSKHTRTAAKPPEDREPQRSPVVKDEDVEPQADNPKTRRIGMPTVWRPAMRTGMWPKARPSNLDKLDSLPCEKHRNLGEGY